MEKIQEVVIIAKKRHISYDKALVIYNKQQAAAPAAPVAKVSEKPVAKVETPAPAPVAVSSVSDSGLFAELSQKMHAGVVKFQYLNKKGVVVTCTGTLNAEIIGKRKPAMTGTRFAGRTTSKKDAVGTYFDTAHGLYRPVVKANVQAILS